MEDYFDCVFLLNLNRRPDRLADSLREINRDWPFLKPIIFPGVDGRLLPLPNNWRDGGGAYGCMLSHRQIFQQIIQEDYKRVLILEDDLTLVNDFSNKVTKFLSVVPDWHQLMIGGQLLRQATPAVDGVLRVSSSCRTHCYAIRNEMVDGKNFCRDLYEHWCNSSGHCDNRMSEIQHKYNVFAPAPFLAGQIRSVSDITCGLAATKYWNDTKNSNLLWLDVPKKVAMQLRLYGVHFGFTINEAGIDGGLVDLSRLAPWVQMIQNEITNGNGTVAGIWHPSLQEGHLAAVPHQRVTASTLSEALSQIDPGQLRKPPDIVLLEAPQEAVKELRARGWHTGNWRDNATDIDNGLETILAAPDADRLSRWLGIVGGEAKEVLAIWHPGRDLSCFEDVTDLPLIKIEGETVAEIIGEYERKRI